MFDRDFYEDEYGGKEERSERRANYRVRRPSSRRRRTKTPASRKAHLPGGIHQRKNKHWSWFVGGVNWANMKESQ